MGNGLKNLDHGLSIANSATTIVERVTTIMDAKVERQASNKLAYTYKTIAQARQFIDTNDLSDRDIKRCESLLDDYVHVASRDIRNTRKGWGN